MTNFKLISVNVGKVEDHDGWTTAFFKLPVEGKAWVSELYVEGDEQHHKKVHGGKFRPILAYPIEHYQKWQADLDFEFPHGAFAENFTVSGGLDEDTVCLGDIYQVGDTLKIQASQPRVPCDQISMRWDMPDLTKRVNKTGRMGWYMSVVEAGYAEAGMPITLLERPNPDWAMSKVLAVYQNRKKRPEEALALSQCEALEIGWRNRLQLAAEKNASL